MSCLYTSVAQRMADFVSRFLVMLDIHYEKHHRKRVTPALPTIIDF